MRHISRMLPLIAILLLVIEGCGGSHSSTSIFGEYLLVKADTRVLPSTIFDATIPDSERPFHLKIIVDEGKLNLRSDGHYEHSVLGKTWIDNQPNLKHRYIDRGLYRIQGQQIQFESDLFEFRSYTGRLVNGRIMIENDIVGEGKNNTFTFQQ